jgi:hypothetical protein
MAPTSPSSTSAPPLRKQAFKQAGLPLACVPIAGPMLCVRAPQRLALKHEPECKQRATAPAGSRHSEVGRRIAISKEKRACNPSPYSIVRRCTAKTPRNS